MHPPGHARQAAADGNQWLLNDIGGRFAPFIELYESSGGRPSTEQLQSFFDSTFGDGDLQIRTGFQAYVAALGESDPARRQQLMFQANTLVATHEQAGAQPYLERAAFGPDGLATRYIDLHFAGRKIEVDDDLRLSPAGASLVVPAPILGLDPSALDPTRLTPGLDFAPIRGWEGNFEVSTRQWYQSAGSRIVYRKAGPFIVAVPDLPDPDSSLRLTGAPSWTVYSERMWYIHRLFEQLHTDPKLFETGRIKGIDLDWVDPSVPLAIG